MEEIKQAIKKLKDAVITLEEEVTDFTHGLGGIDSFNFPEGVETTEDYFNYLSVKIEQAEKELLKLYEEK